MEIRIKELCETKEIESAYRLAQMANLTMPTAYRAFANDIKQFTPETLEKLCKALECAPNDIFGYAPKAESKSLLSVRTAAEKLSVSESKIRAMIADGSLPSERIGGSRWINEKDLAVEFMNKYYKPKKVKE